MKGGLAGGGASVTGVNMKDENKGGLKYGCRGKHSMRRVELKKGTSFSQPNDLKRGGGENLKRPGGKKGTLKKKNPANVTKNWMKATNVGVRGGDGLNGQERTMNGKQGKEESRHAGNKIPLKKKGGSLRALKDA